MKDIISINREFLNVTGEFINKEIYANNNYGIPPYIYKNINKIINNSITYSDLINFLINKIYEKNKLSRNWSFRNEKFSSNQ